MVRLRGSRGCRSAARGTVEWLDEGGERADARGRRSSRRRDERDAGEACDGGGRRGGGEEEEVVLQEASYNFL